MGLKMFNQQFSVTKTASELLFEGYNDPLLDLAKSLPASTTGGAPPVDKFGWFYGVSNDLALRFIDLSNLLYRFEGAFNRRSTTVCQKRYPVF